MRLTQAIPAVAGYDIRLVLIVLTSVKWEILSLGETKITDARDVCRDHHLDELGPTTCVSGTNCTGGPDGNACLVRCRNRAIAGPFGGCVVGE